MVIDPTDWFLQSRIQDLWITRGYSLHSGHPIHLTILASILHSAQYQRKPEFWVLSFNQWSVGTSETGDRRFLLLYCSREQRSWSEFLPWAEFSYALFNRADAILVCPWLPTTTVSMVRWTLGRIRGGCVGPAQSGSMGEGPCPSTAGHKETAYSGGSTERHQHPQYQVGKQVWLSTQNLRLQLPCRKLSPWFICPFKIVQQINTVSYIFRLWFCFAVLYLINCIWILHLLPLVSPYISQAISMFANE